MSHGHEPFLKRWLIPFWILQILFLLLELAVSVLAIIGIATDSDIDNELTDTQANSAKTLLYVLTGLSALSLVLTVVEMVQLCMHTMRPRFYIFSNIVKAVIWVGLTVWGIVAAIQDHDHISTAAIVINAVLVVTFVVPCLYGITVSRRARKQLYRAAGQDAEHVQDVHYDVPYLQDIPPTSDGSAPRRLSYNHERDTRFESYRQRSLSQSDDQDRVFDAMSIPHVTIEAPPEEHNAYEMRSNQFH